MVSSKNGAGSARRGAAEPAEEDEKLARRPTKPDRDRAKMEPLSVRVPEAMRLTGIGRSKLYELIASGDVEIVKVGSATLVTMESLRRLVERGST